MTSLFRDPHFRKQPIILSISTVTREDNFIFARDLRAAGDINTTQCPSSCFHTWSLNSWLAEPDKEGISSFAWNLWQSAGCGTYTYSFCGLHLPTCWVKARFSKVLRTLCIFKNGTVPMFFFYSSSKNTPNS